VETEKTRVAALDYGRTRIGVAISDEMAILASPRPFVPARPPQRALRQLKVLFAQEGVAKVLVGLPRQLDGREGTSADRARKFAAEVEAVCHLPVELVDERLTTVEAQARLREAGIDAKRSRERIDSAAAAVLLQGHLDGRRGR
jgi:putative Holliday junction resolvase